jgi:quercetin dioxygenase-like cupin family protein
MQRIIIVAAALALVFIACDGGEDDVPTGTEQATAEVSRQVLQSGSSDAAPGQRLELTRVVIPSGKEIAPHTHPGPQLALIEEGTLTYSVLSGEVQVTRSGSSTAETIAAGQTTDIEPGDSLAEGPGMVHTAKNAGLGPVVITISALFPVGAPASSSAPQAQ